MTDEQIFELIEKHFHLGCLHDSSYVEWFGETNDFVKFAQKMYIKGYNKGKDEGYEEGWESCDVSTKMNSLGD